MFINFLQFFFNYPLRILLFVIFYTIPLKRRKYFLIIAPIATIIYVCAFYFIPLPSYLYDIVLCSLSALWIFSTHKCSPFVLLYSTVDAYAGGHIAQYLIQFVFSLTTLEENSTLGMVLSFLISVAVVLPSYFLIIKKIDFSILKNDKTTIINSIVILLILLFASECLKLLDNRITNIVFSIFGATCSAYALFAQYSSTTKLYLAEENKKLEDMILQSEKIAKSSLDNNELLNIRCHDLKKQIDLLEKSNNSVEKQELLSDLKDTVRAYDSVIKTGYAPLDVVLSDKYNTCMVNKIKFSYIVDGNCLSFLREVDLYSLIANILDNAIEASIKENEDKRIISLSIVNEKGMVHLQCINYCSKEVEFINGLPKTTKDNENHGFGCKSIKYITDKYNGVYNMRKENDTFITDILLCNENDSS